MASASDDHSIAVWELEHRQKTVVLTGHSTRVTGVAFSPDGGGLASCDFNGTVILWDLYTGCPRRIIPNPDGLRFSPSYALAYSPDGQWVVSSYGVFESSTGRFVFRFAPILFDANGFSFSPDSHYLVTTFRGLILFEAGTWKYLEECRLNPDPIVVGFGPSGRLLATGDVQGQVCLWETSPLRQVGLLGRHAARVKAVVFSPDGQRVASAGDDQTIALWDVARRRLITQIDTHTAPVLALAFSPDGKRLVSGEHDHSVRLYTLRRSLWGFPLD